MRFKDYLKDKLLYIIISLISFILIISLLLIFNVHSIVLILISFILIVLFIFVILYNYFQKMMFYNNISGLLKTLEDKYLISELIKEPNFLEGKLLYDYLYEIDKSMIENINIYKHNNEEFREYIELWCHEIKTPLATSKLIINNNQNDVTNSISEELDGINNYIEQVLFYARSNNVDKDYLIKKTDLNEVVRNVIKRNKKDLLSKKIKIETSINDFVYSDYKWLEFIINQIIVNSIKYSSNNPKISIKTIKNKDNIILSIKDNGIGIEISELSKVFDKGFTGSNGRKKYNSTGIGLYLCKKLCDKLGHLIEINSIINKETEVVIIFPSNSMIEDVI